MTDKEKLIKIKSLADKMYYAAFNLTTDASLLRKAMDDYHQFLVYEYHKEEPVSEDLGEYIDELSKQFPEVSFAKLSRIAVRVSRWQRNQDAKNKLPKVINRTDLDEFAYQCAYDLSNDWAIDNPTWHDVEDACKLGAKWQKEQIKKAMDLGEPPYLISIEQAYYRTLKLLEE